jgi:anti-anti-sigma factor
MDRPYRHLAVRRQGDVFCVHLRSHQLSEPELYELCSELLHLPEKDGCRKLVLNLGPPDPEFLYSIFLAKLVSLQRRLQAVGGGLKIAGTSSATRSIFAACRLDSLFDFVADEESAVQELAAL